MRKATTYCALALSALMILSGGKTQAQTDDRRADANLELKADSEFRLSLLPLIARANSKSVPSFGSNMKVARSRVANPGAGHLSFNFAAVSLASFPNITGNGTSGQIPMFTAGTVIRSSIITQSKAGNIGIDTTTPGSKLTVIGMIETTLGGLKFPDGTIQATAALSAIFHDATLTGDGTSGSPLGVAIPLNLVGSIPGPGSVLSVENNALGGLGMTVKGGFSNVSNGGKGMEASGGDSDFSGGIGVDATGGIGNSSGGGIGVRGRGGNSTSGSGGRGVEAFGGVPGGEGVHSEGGNNNGGEGGAGVNSTGGNISGTGTGGDGVRGFGGQIFVGGTGNGGDGVSTIGGRGRGMGNRGGHGIFARPGLGEDGATDGLAGLFQGNVEITGDLDIGGSLTKGGGAFKIDHPLDPANKFLYHSFVESPDMMNVYNGNITTDASGEAVVALPEWFQALNRDFRYQLTVIGQFAQAIVASEFQENRFKIKTDHPNVKVSWQVTGIRRDPWAEKNRIPIEQEKGASERGQYLYPELYESPDKKGVERARNSEVAKQPQEAKPTNRSASQR